MVDAARGRRRAFPRRERRTCVALAQLPRVPRAACFAAASGAEPAKMRRVAQDCDPTAYMYTPSGRKDAQIGHFSRASTVAAKQAARRQANQHEATTAHHHKNKERRHLATLSVSAGLRASCAGSCRRWSSAARRGRRRCAGTCRGRCAPSRTAALLPSAYRCHALP